jgi:glycosyltransferase involved in cell wall biosynthesis
MRLLVVAAYASTDGSYGGPVAVALDHAAALTSAGHDVTVAAGWDGEATVGSPATLRLFRARRPLRHSFAGLVAPGLLPWVARHAGEFDVVHVHVTRDLVTLPAAWLAERRGVPVVLQTHGQIRPERSWPQGVVDVLLTRRVFRDAAAFLTLTAHEDADLRAQGVDDARRHRVDNGVPLAPAQAGYTERSPLVLYSSRLAERKRPRAFVAAADLIHRARADARFELWGPDGGELSAVLDEIDRRGLSEVCAYRGAAPIDRARAHLADATVFVLPSRAEPFPMALLEAFGAGLPAVITEETGLSALCQETGAARVTDGTPERLSTAVLDLLGSREAWQASAGAARALAGKRFVMARIADRLVDVYTQVAGAGPGPLSRRSPTRSGGGRRRASGRSS